MTVEMLEEYGGSEKGVYGRKKRSLGISPKREKGERNKANNRRGRFLQIREKT